MYLRLLGLLAINLSVFQAFGAPMIAGGKPAAVSEEIGVTQVLLRTYDAQGYSYTCGATVISKNLVLTARHCFNDMKKAELVFNVNKALATKIQIRLGTKLEAEPSDQADIVIMKFSGTLPKGYKPALLGEAGIKLRNGMPVIASGYGATKTNGADYGILRKVEIKVTEFNASLIAFPGPSDATATAANYRGTIKGDSGGGLFAKDAEGNLRLIGVHSGANYGYAATFCVRVKPFLNWITKIISEN